MNKKTKAEIEKPHMRRHWGQRRLVRPMVLDEIFGDGKQLVCLSPLNTRPQYYVVQIDSGITDLNGDEFRDLLDEKIYGAIEEQFGSVPKDDNGENDRCAKWPELDNSVGSTWCRMDLPRVAAKKAKVSA